MKYSLLPVDLFKHIQINAGILAKSFNPETGEVKQADIFGATSGGITFSATPSFTDFGEDIDNCPKNMKEMKKLDTWEAKASGTYVSVTSKSAKSLLAAADESNGVITPRNELLESDFTDAWMIGDYSEVNDDGKSAGKAGYIAVRLVDALSTGGFQIKTSDAGKGQFAFEYTAHYSMDDPQAVPFKVYIKQGSAE